MTAKYEHEFIRLGTEMRRQLNVSIGDKLVMLDPEGVEIIFSVREIPPILSAEMCGYVTAQMFSRINFGPPTAIEQITLGCDPEFFYLDNTGKVVQASTLLPKKAKLGNDGFLAELRPDPTKTVGELVENLRALIKQSEEAPAKKGKKVFAASFTALENHHAGFHVHLGLPLELIYFAPPLSITFIRKVVSLLDYFVGLPSIIPEETDSRRLYSKYGKPSDFRMSPQTLEYRTVSGYFLRHPDLTAGLLGTSLAVVEDAVENAEKMSFGWRDLRPLVEGNNFEQMYETLPAKRTGYLMQLKDKTPAREELLSISEKLRKLSNYGKYKQEIETFLSSCVAAERPSPRLLKNW
jgi:hypothetical protein